MRVDPGLLHPPVRRKIDGGLADPRLAYRHAAALAGYQREWVREHGLALVGWLVAFFAATALADAASAAAGPLVHAAAVCAAMAFVALGILRYIFEGLRRPTLRKVAAIAPALGLDEVEDAYVRIAVALDGRPPVEFAETMADLNALMDERDRLRLARTALVGGSDRGEPARLRDEREDLVRRRAQAPDGPTADALDEALALAEARRVASRSAQDAVDGIDARLDLLRQAVLSARDSAERRRAAPSAVASTPHADLRQALDRVQGQAGETERALDELRTW